MQNTGLNSSPRRHSRSKSRTRHRRRSRSDSSSSSTSLHTRSRSRRSRDGDRPFTFDIEQLKKVKINIKGNQSGECNIRRELDPAFVSVVRRPGEGSRPIFDRDEIRRSSSQDSDRIVRQSSSRSRSRDRTRESRSLSMKADRRIFWNSPSRSRSGTRSPRRSLSSHRSRSRSRSRRRRSRSSYSSSRSRSGSSPRSHRRLIDQRYVKRQRRGRSRSRSRLRRRSRSPRRRRSRDRDPYRVLPIPIPVRAIRPPPYMRGMMPFPGPIIPPRAYLTPAQAAAIRYPRGAMRLFFRPNFQRPPLSPKHE